MRYTCLLAFVGLAVACGQPPKLPVPSAQPVVIDHDTSPSLAQLAEPSADESVPFFQGGDYDPGVTTIKSCLGGVALGARLAAPEAIVGCFRQWAKDSPRVQVERYALSYEGRELVRAVISSPANLAKLDDILARLDKLADPRGLSAAEAERIIAATPAVAWFGYSIHGDEVSGADASLAFGYHLLAARSPEVRALLDRAVVVIDPVMNPDGRARIMSQIAQSASLVANLNDTSMHRGRWPWGRGNHYLFDMNRDWLVGAAPETRGRWREISRFHPQLIIDAHEMGAQETYLFYPQNDPINPHLSPALTRWHKVFASDHSRAFDAFGWAYYTREWADGWYPGYTDLWGALTGAIGILYEQASSKGQPVRKDSGRVVTYRETVHGQAVSSLANLTTLVRNREPLLRDYLTYRQAQVTPTGTVRMFAVRPGRHPDRERHLLTLFLRQGVEVYRADKGFAARGSESALGEQKASLDLPEGTWLIPAVQPRGALVKAMLTFDEKLDKALLTAERAELERTGRSKLYDVTAWNLGQAFALDCYWIDAPRVAMSQVTEVPKAPVGLRSAVKGLKPEDAYAWIVDGRDDGSLMFAARALEDGLVVHVADEPFAAGGEEFPRGSLVVRRGAQQKSAGQSRAADGRVAARVGEVARAAKVAAHAVATGLSATDGPDLGGTHFHLLHRPRVAVIANWPVWPSSFGHIWYQLDRRIGMPITFLDAQSLGRYDLRRYNVIVIPPASGALGSLLQPYKQMLAAWVRGGGTLIAVGSSAVTLASPQLGISTVRRRRDVLDKLALYDADAKRNLAARKIEVDEAALWGDGTGDGTGASASAARPGAPPAAGQKQPASKPASGSAKPAGGADGAKAQDAWRRRFAPDGAILRGLMDGESWLTLGYGEEAPVLVTGSHVLLARSPARVPVRLAPAARLRLSGLLWPEARARLEKSAYVTVERAGAGQVILFASPPSFRAHYIGTARLLGNAVVYGPSLGARQPRVW